MSQTTAALIDTVRVFSGALVVASIPLVVSDSLSKKVDVVGLKDKLDLKEARLHSIVVISVEKALSPHLNSDLSSIGAELGFNPPLDGDYLSAPKNLSETAKDALVDALRRCGPVFAEIIVVSGLPKRLAALNRSVYALSVLLAIVAATVLAATFWMSNSTEAWLSIVLLTITLISIVTCAVLRQIKVQNAEQAIIYEDPQPRA